jgi:hypothetical protein
MTAYIFATVFVVNGCKKIGDKISFPPNFFDKTISVARRHNTLNNLINQKE